MDSIATLLVDDEPDSRMLMLIPRDTANEGLYDCGEADDGQEAVAVADDTSPDAIRSVVAN